MDRLAYHAIKKCRTSGHQCPETMTLIVPTSANLALSLALMASRHRYRIIAVIPHHFHLDRSRLMKAAGVEVCRAQSDAPPDSGYSVRGIAQKLHNELPESHIVDPTDPVLFDGAYSDLVDEIIKQHSSECHIDCVILGYESCGLIASALKARSYVMGRPKLIVAVGQDSFQAGEEHCWQPSKVDGLYCPVRPLVAPENIDEFMVVNDKEAYEMSRRLRLNDGMLVGSSSGAVMAAALRVASQTDAHVNMVVIFEDSALNYPNTLLNNQWLFENDFLTSYTASQTISSLNLPHVSSAAVDDSVQKCIQLMIDSNSDYIKLLKGDGSDTVVGYISLDQLNYKLKTVQSHGDILFQTADKHMIPLLPLPEEPVGISMKASIHELDNHFDRNLTALITDAMTGCIVSICTKSDLLKFQLAAEKIRNA